MNWIPLTIGGVCCIALGAIACAMVILPEARERIRRRSQVIAIQRAHIAELNRDLAMATTEEWAVKPWNDLQAAIERHR